MTKRLPPSRWTSLRLDRKGNVLVLAVDQKVRSTGLPRKEERRIGLPERSCEERLAGIFHAGSAHSGAAQSEGCGRLLAARRPRRRLAPGLLSMVLWISWCRLGLGIHDSFGNEGARQRLGARAGVGSRKRNPRRGAPNSRSGHDKAGARQVRAAIGFSHERLQRAQRFWQAGRFFAFSAFFRGGSVAFTVAASKEPRWRLCTNRTDGRLCSFDRNCCSW